MNWLLELIDRFMTRFYPPQPLPMPPTTPQEAPKPPQDTSYALKLYNASKAAMGKDITPADNIPDNVACVAQLQEVHRRAFGHYIGNGAALYSTTALIIALREDDTFLEIEMPEVGSIVVSPSTNITHGHCGLVMQQGICSNDSTTGLWQENYSIAHWESHFSTVLKLGTYYFKKVAL